METYLLNLKSKSLNPQRLVELVNGENWAGLILIYFLFLVTARCVQFGWSLCWATLHFKFRLAPINKSFTAVVGIKWPQWFGL